MPPETATKESMMDAFLDELASRMAAKSQADPWQAGWKHTTPSGTPTTNYMHGPGGIFGVAGIERDIFSTRIQPRGLAGALPGRGTIRTNPLFGYITGFQANTGDVADGVCDDCGVAGPTKSCLQTADFGRYCYMTKEIEVNRVGQQTNRGEFLDLRLVNDPLLADTGGVLGQNINGTPNLRREVLQAFVELGVSFQNQLIPQVYIGNPANNSAGGGSKQFPGLDILIGTGKVDAITGTNCPSLDSDIKDFNYGLVCEESSGTDIVETVTYMMRYLRHNADRQNFNPVRWVITMRRELFWELTACWPCSYLTYRCTFRAADTQAQVNVDAADHVAMRDQMRNGNYLLIDGERVDVVIDDGIVEEADADNAAIGPGEFASDIYFIPMTIKGGMAVTYWEYLDYSQGAMMAVEDGRLQSYYWTDGGRFSWHAKPPKNWCNQWMAKIEPRIIFLTPQLAGRIQNVRYAPLQHTRDPFPSDPYFVDGGETSRTGPSYYSDWNLPGG